MKKIDMLLIQRIFLQMHLFLDDFTMAYFHFSCLYF